MRYSRIVTAALATLVLSSGCGSTEEPDDMIIIITDEPAQTSSTEPSPNDAPAANNTIDPAANNTADPANNALPDPDPDPNNNTSPDPDPDPDPNNNTTPDPDPEPCGNGTLDAGETCDGNCPSSCNDGDPCTIGTMSGDAAVCTAVCTYEPDAACDAWQGSYSGSYYIKAEEKVGSSVINSMTCSGTFTAEVDMSEVDNLVGTADCTYGGGLTIFDSNQSATITGNIAPDGTFTARIRHESGAPNDGSWSIDGTLVGGTLVVDDTGSYRPHPQSAVGWETIIKLN